VGERSAFQRSRLSTTYTGSRTPPAVIDIGSRKRQPPHGRTTQRRCARLSVSAPLSWRVVLRTISLRRTVDSRGRDACTL